MTREVDGWQMGAATEGLNEAYFTYDPTGNQTKMILRERDENGTFLPDEVTHFVYDALNRETMVINDLGHATRKAYDSRGNVVFESDGNNPNLVEYLQSSPYGGGGGGSGSIMVNTHGNTTLYEYDDADRLTKTTRHLRAGGKGNGAVVGQIASNQEFDAAGNLEAQIDDSGNRTEYAYDSLNRRVQTTFDALGDATTETVEYDERDLPRTRTDPNGTVIRNLYDLAGRVQTRTIMLGSGSYHGVPYSTGGTTQETFEYDGMGRITVANDGDSKVTRQFDTLGRIVAETTEYLPEGDTHVVSFEYDGLGNVLKTTYPGGGLVVSNTFDDLNRLETVTADGVHVASYEYEGADRVSTRTLSWGAHETHLDVYYDQIGQTTESVHSFASGVPIDHRTYEWDRAGNKIERVDELASGAHQYFDYDSTYRLERSERFVTGQTVTSNDYSGFDGVGNRTSVAGGPASGTFTLGVYSGVNAYSTHTYTPAGSAFAVTAGYAYDKNGNLIEREIEAQADASVVYDYQNRMVSFADHGLNATHTYRYDAHGRRIEKVVESATGGLTTTRYVWGGQQTLEERDENGVALARYVFGAGIDEVLRRTDLTSTPEEHQYYHTDDQGNVVAVTGEDSGGFFDVLERYAYDDYGVLLDAVSFDQIDLTSASASLLGNPWFFASRNLDVETGWTYFRNRYLEPLLGRFTTRDPIGIWGDEVNVGNGYSYIGNNPWSRRDPLGLGWFSDLLDTVQTGLDVVGLVPGLGEVADLANAGISLARGNIGDAATSLAAMVPIAGAAATGAKWVRKASKARKQKKAAEVVKGTAGNAGGAAKTGSRTAPDKPPKEKGKSEKGEEKGDSDPNGPREKSDADATSSQGGCFVAGTSVLTEDGLVPIEFIRVGDRVLTSPAGRQDSSTEVDPDAWRTVWLVLYGDGDWNAPVLISWLRPLAWIEGEAAITGQLLERVEIEEIGVAGPAQVLAVLPCPELATGKGRVVTATMRRLSSDILDLATNTGEQLGVTGGHRVFSKSRQAWVPARDLWQGERLSSYPAQDVLAESASQAYQDVVFNLAVEGDQRFHVGSASVLVHNDCPKKGQTYVVDGKDTPSGKDYVGTTSQGSPAKRGKRDGRDRAEAEVVDEWDPNDKTARRQSEQREMNNRGGVDELDNKRNEIREADWEDNGVPPPSDSGASQ